MKNTGFRLAALAFFVTAIVLTSGLANAKGVGSSERSLDSC
jgi:hypothetical protein